MQRNPSHFGSNSQPSPSGMVRDSLASIGRNGGCRGRHRSPMILPHRRRSTVPVRASGRGRRWGRRSAGRPPTGNRTCGAIPSSDAARRLHRVAAASRAASSDGVELLGERRGADVVDLPRRADVVAHAELEELVGEARGEEGAAVELLDRAACWRRPSRGAPTGRRWPRSRRAAWASGLDLVGREQAAGEQPADAVGSVLVEVAVAGVVDEVVPALRAAGRGRRAGRPARSRSACRLGAPMGRRCGRRPRRRARGGAGARPTPPAARRGGRGPSPGSPGSPMTSAR